VLAAVSELVAGASPTGFEGLTSSSGEFLSTVGADLGGGPRSVSGVGVGAGATRRGLDDWAGAAMAAAKIKTTPNRNRWPAPLFSGLGNRFFIWANSFRFRAEFTNQIAQIPSLHTVFSGRGRGDIRMRRADCRFAIKYAKSGIYGTAMHRR